MKQMLRFSVSGVIGILITIALFIGMLSLIKGNKSVISSTETDINFSFVKDFTEPEVIPPKTTKPPEPEVVKQPPSAPILNMDNTKVDPDNNVPIAGTKGNDLNILKGVSIPGAGGVGDYSVGNPGGIKAAIAPMYPPQQLMSKTEGWVKVQISVNEFGTVSGVSIIDAKPSRVFDAAAKKAVRKWKFHPKVVDGVAMPFVATQTIEFKIEQ